MDQTWQSLKGQFLMAMPGLADPNFYQSVTCLSEHNPKGAMGIVLTRVHPTVNGKMIFDELQIPTAAGAEKIPIHIGGPVHMNEIFVLHGCSLHLGRQHDDNRRTGLEQFARYP